jgi:hypothetical protein
MSKEQWMFVYEWTSARPAFKLSEALTVAQHCIKEGWELDYENMDKATWRLF